MFDRGTGETHEIGTRFGSENSATLVVDNDGFVVGFGWRPSSAALPFRVAFLYDHRTGQLTDPTAAKQAPGRIPTDAHDIDDRGEIVGRARFGSAVGAVLLRPVGRQRLPTLDSAASH